MQVIIINYINQLLFSSYALELVDFIVENIPTDLQHTGSGSFDEHLLGVQAVLRHWKADSYVADAGLFHSIYGTEAFQGHKLPLSKRDKLRSLIGDRLAKF